MGESAAVPQLDPADSGDDEPFLGMAWAEAIEATELLRSALAALGLAGEIPRLRGDVNVYGRPMVTVGRISPTAARRLAAALSQAAQHQPRIYGQAPPGPGENGTGQPPEPTRGLRPPRTATPLNLPVAVPMATVLPVTIPAPSSPSPPSSPPSPSSPSPPSPSADAPDPSPADSVRLPA